MFGGIEMSSLIDKLLQENRKLRTTVKKEVADNYDALINRIDELELENRRMRECIGIISCDNWVCGEYRDNESDYFELTEKEIALKCLEELK